MSFQGHSLRVIKKCEPLELGETVFCIEDLPDRQVFRIWTQRPIFGVNEVIMPYARRNCFKIV